MNQLRQILALAFGKKEKDEGTSPQNLNQSPPAPIQTPESSQPTDISTAQGDKAVENSDAGRELINAVIQRLYENESITSALTDNSAKMLLTWGEAELTNLAPFNPTPQQVDDLSEQASRVLRAINRLVERQADLTEEEMVETLIQLVQNAMKLGVIEFKIEKGEIDDQKTDNQETKQ